MEFRGRSRAPRQPAARSRCSTCCDPLMKQSANCQHLTGHNLVWRAGSRPAIDSLCRRDRSSSGRCSCGWALTDTRAAASWGIPIVRRRAQPLPHQTSLGGRRRVRCLRAHNRSPPGHQRPRHRDPQPTLPRRGPRHWTRCRTPRYRQAEDQPRRRCSRSRRNGRHERHSTCQPTPGERAFAPRPTHGAIHQRINRTSRFLAAEAKFPLWLE